MELIEQHASAGGWQNVYRHNSQTLNCGMNFGVYLPPKAATEKLPVLYWLSGLTCTEQNFSERLSILVGEVDASTAKGIHGLAEENEDIRVHVVSREQAYQWVEEGKIDNAASVIALQWLQLHYHNLRNEWTK